MKTRPVRGAGCYAVMHVGAERVQYLTWCCGVGLTGDRAGVVSYAELVQNVAAGHNVCRDVGLRNLGGRRIRLGVWPVILCGIQNACAHIYIQNTSICLIWPTTYIYDDIRKWTLPAKVCSFTSGLFLLYKRTRKLMYVHGMIFNR